MKQYDIYSKRKHTRMKQYDIYSDDRKLNEFPIEADNEEQLEAFVEIGLCLDLKGVTYKPAKVISPNDLTFEKTSENTFSARSEGVYMYHAFIEKGKISYIDSEGIWDNNTKTPLEWFKRMPNFNLEF